MDTNTAKLFPPTEKSRELVQYMLMLMQAVVENEEMSEGEVINSLVFLTMCEAINGGFEIDVVVRHIYYMAYKIEQAKAREEVEELQSEVPYIVKTDPGEA